MDRTLDYLKNLRRGHVLLLLLLFMAMNISAKDAGRWTNPDTQESALQPRNYVEMNFGIPGDTISNKKKGPRKAHTINDWNISVDEAYSIYLDGEEFYAAIRYDNIVGDFEFYEDGDAAILTAEDELVKIPDKELYNGMYDESYELKAKAYCFANWDNINIMTPVGGYDCYKTQDDFEAEHGSNDDWWAWSRSFYEYQKSQPWIQASLNAEHFNTLTYEDVFGILDNTKTENQNTARYDGEGCVPDFLISPRDDGFRAGNYDDDAVVKNLGIKELIVPSKVKLLRWLPDRSATYHYVSYTPYLETVTFASNDNMRQIGGFKDHKYLKECAIGELTELKVIEAECFKGCTSLNVDSVDLRDKWVGAEAFNGASANHLDIDAFNTQKGQDAKLYGVKCPEIKIHHDDEDTQVLDPAKFLKKINGHYVLDDDKESVVLVPCRLYNTYVHHYSASDKCGWSDIAGQISYYLEDGYEDEETCPEYYVIIDGVRVFKDVVYTKDASTNSYTLVSVGDTKGEVLEIPHDFADLHADEADYVVRHIGPNVCKGRKDFKQLILPTSIEVIGTGAFRESGLEHVNVHGKESTKYNTWPRGLKEIKDYAFFRSQLKDGMSFPYGIRKLGRYSFAETRITSLYLPGSLTDNNYVFKDNGDLDFDASTFAVGDWSFYFCGDLASLTVGEGITGLGGTAFKRVYSLASVSLPNSLKYIGQHFLCGDVSIQELTIPASVTDIDGAFLHGNESLRNCRLFGPPSMLKTASSTNDGASIGPVLWPAESHWGLHDCHHVNNCLFTVNDEETYHDYINFVNSNGERVWLRLDRYDLDYNLAGSDNPNYYYISVYHAMAQHIAAFPKNYGLDGEYHEGAYEEAAQHLQSSSAKPGMMLAGPRKAIGDRTTDPDVWQLTGYHNRYQYYPPSEEIPLPKPEPDPDTPDPQSPDPDDPKPGDPDYPDTPPSVTYHDKWATICFPFKPVKAKLDELIGADAIIAEYTGARLDDGYPTPNVSEEDEYFYNLTFTAIDHGDIVADKPYLIRPTTGKVVNITMYSSTPIALYNNVATPMTADHWTEVIETTQHASNDPSEADVVMKGTYLETKLAKAEFYLKNVWDDTDNAWAMNFYKAAAANQVTVKPFRCYFRILKDGLPVNNAKIGTFFTLEDEVDGITTVTRQDVTSKRPGVYTLSGQRIARNSEDVDFRQLPAGVYIVDGEKVVKK